MPTRTPQSCDEVVPARPHTTMPIILQTIYDTQDMRGSKSVSRDIALETFGQQGVPNRLHSNCPYTHIVVFCACVARLVALEKPGDAEKECGTNGRNAIRNCTGLSVPSDLAAALPWKQGLHAGSLSHSTESPLLSLQTLISCLSSRLHCHAAMAIAIQNALLSIGLLLRRWTLSDCYHLPPLVTSLFCPHTPGFHTCPKTTVEKPPSLHQMELSMLRPIQ